MPDKIMLTRNQIAKIVNNNPEAIKAFELLFKQSTINTPLSVEATSIESGNGVAMGAENSMQIERMKDDVLFSALSPRYEPSFAQNIEISYYIPQVEIPYIEVTHEYYA